MPPRFALGRPALVAGLLLLGTATDARAHGGQFRGPAGNVPAGGRSPSDPVAGWWEANVDALVGLDSTGPVTTDGAGDLGVSLFRAREDKIVPFLRTVVAGKRGNDPDLMAAAVLALAKTTSEPADVETILALSEDPSRPRLVLEAAALAPGLLRRSEPKQRFDPSLLDRVRGRCLAVYDGRTQGSRRVRASAALALGLLGDQPTMPFVAGAPRLDVAFALLERLKAADDVEFEVALSIALGLQASTFVSRDVLDALRGLASTGVLASRPRPSACRAHAIVAYARLAGAEASGLLFRFLRAPHEENDLRHAAMAALGVVAGRLYPLARTAAAGEVSAHADRGNPETVGLALLTLGRLFGAAFEDGADRTTIASPAAELLLRQIDEGPGAARSVAALATGLALRPSPAPELDAAGSMFRLKAVDALTKLDDERTDPALRGVAYLALGLSRGAASAPRLVALVGRRDMDVELRARAATALGLLGLRGTDLLEALRAALDTKAPDVVRREAARSLGYLGDVAALPALVADLRANLSDAIRSRAAAGLGALHRTAAVDPLIELASDRSAGDLARAVAVAALGLLADPERVRSLSRLATDLGGSLVSDALGQALALM